MTALPKVIPINELKNTAQISQVCKESSVPIIITKNGRSDMVLMSVSLFEETFVKAQAAMLINEALDEIKAGAKGIDADEFFNKISNR